MQLDCTRPQRPLVSPATWADVEPAVRAQAYRRSIERELRQAPRARRAALEELLAAPGEGMFCSSGAGASSAATASSSAAPPAPPAVPLSLFLIYDEGETIANAASGTGDAIAGTTTQTLTDAAAPFSANTGSQTMVIAGATNAANNGEFLGNVDTTVASTFSYENPTPGVAEAVYGGAWTTLGRFSQVVDIHASKVFAQATVANRPVLGKAVAGKPTKNCARTTAGPSGSTPFRLELTDAVLAATFEGVDISYSCRLRLTTGTSFSPLFVIDDGTTNTDIIFDLTSTAQRCTWDDAGSSATTLSVTTPALPLDTWFSWGLRLNKIARTVSYYQNGAFVATGAAGTNRTPTGLTRFLTGIQTAAATMNGWRGGEALYAGAWSDAQFLAVHNSFLSYGY